MCIRTPEEVLEPRWSLIEKRHSPRPEDPPLGRCINRGPVYRMPGAVRTESSVQTLKRLLPQCLLPDQVRLGQRLLHALGERRAGREVPMPVERWIREAESSVATRSRRGAIVGKICYPAELPIVAHRDTIVAALRQHPVVVIAGETGSGKTTQLPKMCLEAGLGLRARIGCTQPRRVAAVSISRRLAEELHVEWGTDVGCKIRFSDRCRPETSVKFVTDGMLLAEIQGDPMLAEYEGLVLDEAHERSINIDFLLGYLNRLLAKRDDLRLVITSATIDTEVFSRAFNHAPVIEVSGRVYPVEVQYRPLDEQAQESGDLTFIDAAVSQVERVLTESEAGDILVFMPGERDIRETCDRLRQRQGDGFEVIPLFGRLTGAEQQRVFAPGPLRRVVVATNIAETSLTVPRIRTVIDTGLARISRYNPGTRSRRLPIEPIAQSSANQRQGRCGRLGAGVCVRLYSEEDFSARRPFAEPEIQRCDLAEVLLRMIAFGLGDIETFPFLDPPSPTAIRSAYELLQELGALDEARALTALGSDLARLPVAPALGRMVLEAQRERALREVLVIAAGLSIQDPRERPQDQRDKAEAAHRRFLHPESDFLALLNIWNLYHDTLEALPTQNQARKFCRSHFLSYVRMREWQDLHAQLAGTLEELGGFSLNARPADGAAVHRSILTGLWGHVGQRTDRNLYRISGNRQVMLFPGSVLFAKTGRSAGSRVAGPAEPSPTKSSQPPWIVAGEIVETSRPFARSVAAIEPDWILELAPHLVRVTVENPRWDAARGQVLATERTWLRGLVLRERNVGYVTVDPAAATAIFIRCALVEEGLLGETVPETEKSRRPPGGRFPFLDANRALCEKIELWQTRLSQRRVPDLDEALNAFYAARVHAVGSVHDLHRWLREHEGGQSLCATEKDLLGSDASGFDPAVFPDAIAVGTREVPVAYAYAPGQEHDGITLQLTVPLAEAVDSEQLDWAVPVLREPRVLQLLQALPKSLRRLLMPLSVRARDIVAHIDASPASYVAAMSEFIRRQYGVEIPVAAWPVNELPDHLRPRIQVVGRDHKLLALGRDLQVLREQLHRQDTVPEQEAWKKAVVRWERYGLAAWDLGDVPESVVVTEEAGLPLLAFPGLQLEEGDVNLRLFRRSQDAVKGTGEAWTRLAAQVLKRELGWVHKELQVLERLAPLLDGLGPVEELVETAHENLRRHLFPAPVSPLLQALVFDQYVAAARSQLPGVVHPMLGWIEAILRKRHRVRACRRPFPSMAEDLEALVPRKFLLRIPFKRLADVPRYLQAMLVRAERAILNPAKDAERVQRVAPYVKTAWELRHAPPASPEQRAHAERFVWLVEEFKVSCFAQELGTAEPVSPKRLAEAIANSQGPIPNTQYPIANGKVERRG